MPTGSSHRSGPVPKPPDKRRNTVKPSGYGLAEPIKAGETASQPDLSFDPHPAVRRMWTALRDSVEARFFSAADWERANMEMLFINETLTNEKGISASNWQRVQQGLNELLISPADKRRAGIELKGTVDADEDAAIDQITAYRDALAS